MRGDQLPTGRRPRPLLQEHPGTVLIATQAGSTHNSWKTTKRSQMTINLNECVDKTMRRGAGYGRRQVDCMTSNPALRHPPNQLSTKRSRCRRSQSFDNVDPASDHPRLAPKRWPVNARYSNYKPTEASPFWNTRTSLHCFAHVLAQYRRLYDPVIGRELLTYNT